MDAVLIFMIFIGVVILLGLGVWIFTLITKKDEEVEDKNIIINWLPQYTTPIKGHFIGTEVSCIRVGNRELIEMEPKDVSNKDLKDFKEIPHVFIVADIRKMDIIPMGGGSKRNIKIIYPPHPEDFPQIIKNTRYGQFMMAYVEKLDVDNTEIGIVREGSKRKTRLLYKRGDGEISEDYMESQEELTKDLLKSVADSKNQPKTSFTPSHGSEVR